MFVLLCAVTVYVHYLFGLAFFAYLTYVLWRRRDGSSKVSLSGLVVAGIGVCVLVAPLLIQVMHLWARRSEWTMNAAVTSDWVASMLVPTGFVIAAVVGGNDSGVDLGRGSCSRSPRFGCRHGSPRVMAVDAARSLDPCCCHDVGRHRGLTICARVRACGDLDPGDRAPISRACDSAARCRLLSRHRVGPYLRGGTSRRRLARIAWCGAGCSVRRDVVRRAVRVHRIEPTRVARRSRTALVLACAPVALSRLVRLWRFPSISSSHRGKPRSRSSSRPCQVSTGSCLSVARRRSLAVLAASSGARSGAGRRSQRPTSHCDTRSFGNRRREMAWSWRPIVCVYGESRSTISTPWRAFLATLYRCVSILTPSIAI